MLRNPGDGLAKADLLPRGFGHHGFALLVGLLALLALPGVAAATTIISFQGASTPPSFLPQSAIAESNLTLISFSPAISFLSITANYSVGLFNIFGESTALGTGAEKSASVGPVSPFGSSAGSSITGPAGLAIRLNGDYDGSNFSGGAGGANATERWRFTLAQTTPVTLEFFYFGIAGDTEDRWSETFAGLIQVETVGERWPTAF